MKIAMIGHKRIPSREGGVEIVVEELATRMVEKGHSVTVYNRKGKHVSGGKTVNLKEYKGVKIKSVPTFENGKLNAIVYSVIATFLALFGRYDVIHFHAEGPCSMIWLPHLFGIHTVATYFKLRDVADAVGGFNVGFSDNTITIDTDTAAEPTPTPLPSFTPAQISIVKGDDGYDYTSDGIEIEYVDGVAYIDETDIQYMLNKLNANNSNHSYHFGTDIIIDSETLDVVVDNIKRCNTDRRLIELDSYTTKILPFINSVTE